MGFFSKLLKPKTALRAAFDPVGTVIREATGQPHTLKSAVDPAGLFLKPSVANPSAATAADLPPLGSTPLPPALQVQPVPYSYPTTDGLLTKLAFQMAGNPNFTSFNAPQSGQGIPIGGPAPGFRIPTQPPTATAQSLPMRDPMEIARMLRGRVGRM